jgi:hypothetical protein
MSADDSHFTLDSSCYTAWIGDHHDAEFYREVNADDEHATATAIDEMFADALDAGAIAAPVRAPQLRIDVRASRSSVLVMIAGDYAYPLLSTRPIETKELVEVRGGGGAHAIETVRILVEHANELIEHYEQLRSAQITLTDADVGDLAAHHTINAPCGPHGQEMALRGRDFDEDAITALREWRRVSVDGWTFTAAKPEPRTP